MSTFAGLMYHNLERRPSHAYAIEPSAFEDQLAWLAAGDYVVEGFPGLEERLSQPLSAFPQRYCVLSFDDGHESNLLAAEMILRAGFQATFFITRAARLKPGFLREDGIRELARSCSIGSHGVTHRSLIKLSAPELRQELVESKEWLEDLSGSLVRWLGAPGGAMNPRVRRRALEAGYTLVGDSTVWWNRPGRVASSRLVRRTMVFPSYDPRLFARIVRRDAGFFVPRRARSAALSGLRSLLSEKAFLALARWKRKILDRSL